MKKFVALALFAVMVLMMIPAANAAYGQTAKFISKVDFEKGEVDIQYIEEHEENEMIETVKDGNVYSAKVAAGTLDIAYKNKYDAEGKAYYYVIIPIPTEIVTGTYKWSSVKLNGEEVLKNNAIAGAIMGEGFGYYVVGYADMANGFNKTYTWTASNSTSNVTVKYTVKLIIEAPAAPLSALKYNFTGKGDGYAISTKNGIVYVDIAPAYLRDMNKVREPFKAVATFTVDGKNPIPDKEFGYVTVNTFTVNEDTDYVNVFGSQFKNTDTINVELAPLGELLYALGIETANDALEEGITLDDVRLNAEVDTSKGVYKTGDVKVIYRWVEVGDPKGIYFTDGASKTVELGTTFTLPVEGKEATLMEDVEYIVLDSNVLLQNGNEFFAANEGVAYVRVNYTYYEELYSDTIKIIVAEEPATTAYYVVCRALNVRKGPSTSYGKVGLVYRNDVVDVISVDNGWAKIWFEGAERYVSFKYIDQK